MTTRPNNIGINVSGTGAREAEAIAEAITDILTTVFECHAGEAVALAALRAFEKASSVNTAITGSSVKMESA